VAGKRPRIFVCCMCVVACCSALQCRVRCSVLLCGALCCSVLQYAMQAPDVASSCAAGVLQRGAVSIGIECWCVLVCVCVCVAVCCSVLQCVAAYGCMCVKVQMYVSMCVRVYMYMMHHHVLHCI